MPIRIIVINGLNCPVIVCDHCQHPIEKASDGNVHWFMGRTIPAEGVHFLHKRCTYTFENAHGGRDLWRWMPLKAFPVYLARNMDLTIEDAERIADLAGSL